MASDLSFMEYIADQLEGVGLIAYKKMFGEYTIYCDGKVVALVCDNRLFVKPTKGGRCFVGSITEDAPYPGAKLCFLVEDRLEDREWLCDLIRITTREIPAPRPKKTKQKKDGG